MTISRRLLLQRSAAAGLGLVAGGLKPFELVTPAWAKPNSGPTPSTDWGSLVPDPAGILDLPAGFSYRIVTRSGQPLAGPGAAGVVPGRPDGSASFPARHGGVYLVNNHELGQGETHPAVAAPELTYDPGAQGGTTTLLLDRDFHKVAEYVSLAGTVSNCAGGLTPWGTWLTCEETEQKIDAVKGFTEHHGYVFEIDPSNPANNRRPQPLEALGRFAHEAAAIDPKRGVVYLTEDASKPNGLVYRCTPDDRRGGYGSLRGGGTLEAMWVPGVPDLSVYTTEGTELPVRWKPVPDPTALGPLGSTRKQFSWTDLTDRSAPVTVDQTAGEITRSRKFEGLWWGDDRLYLVCSFARNTDSGDWSVGAHDGQVWSFDPKRSTLRLELHLPLNTDPDGAGADVPDGPDNITVNPYGGLFLAEDGEGRQHLVSVTPSGDPQIFARNAVSGSEFTGVNFSPDQRTLFANIQDDGYVFAITGPFGQFGSGGHH